MDPSTDKVTRIDVDGRTIEVIQPGALLRHSSNWRLTLSAFERYRAHLTTAISNAEQGRETAFDVPPDVSPNTFCARLRDARQALVLFGYDATLQDRLRSLCARDRADYVISMDPDGKRVWFRQKGTQGRPAKLIVEQIKRPHSAPENVSDLPTEDELRAMCLLIHKGRLSGPFHFRGTLPLETCTSIESEFDVAFAFDEATQVTTLI